MWKCRVGGRCKTLWALEWRFGGRTSGPADQMTGHPHDWEFQGISSQNEYFFDSVHIF